MSTVHLHQPASKVLQNVYLLGCPKYEKMIQNKASYILNIVICNIFSLWSKYEQHRPRVQFFFAKIKFMGKLNFISMDFFLGTLLPIHKTPYTSIQPTDSRNLFVAQLFPH